MLSFVMVKEQYVIRASTPTLNCSTTLLMVPIENLFSSCFYNKNKVVILFIDSEETRCRTGWRR